MIEPDDNEATDRFDPGIDILVGLIAVILLSVIAILPLAELTNSRNQEINRVLDDLLQGADSAAAEQGQFLILAQTDGVTVSGQPPFSVPLDDLLDHQALRSKMIAAFNDGTVPVVLIEEKGQESAFLLETLLSHAGFRQISRVFLDRSCAFFISEFRPPKCGFTRRGQKVRSHDNAR